MGFLSGITKTIGKVGGIAAPFVAKSNPALGAALEVASSAFAQHEQNKTAQKNADTTYQRTVRDLKAAGLSPLLAYQGAVDPMPNQEAPYTATTASAIHSGQQARTQANLNAKLEKWIDLEKDATVSSAKASAEKDNADAMLKKEQVETEKTKQVMNRLTADLTKTQQKYLQKNLDELLPLTIKEVEHRIENIKEDTEQKRKYQDWIQADITFKEQSIAVAVMEVGIKQQLADSQCNVNAAMAGKLVSEANLLDAEASMTQMDADTFEALGISPATANGLLEVAKILRGMGRR